MDNLIEQVIDFLFFLFPFFLVIILGFSLFNLWLVYIRKLFLEKQEYTLLRIYPTREIYKTPAAMEMIIESLYQTGGEGDWVDLYWKGQSRPTFSLEIVSHGGEIAFYMWTRKEFSKMIENQIYAQYPGVEVEQVEDYSQKIDYESGNFSIFGVEFKLTASDPLPIKTYVDYNLDKPSENPGSSDIDPLSTTLEAFGSIRQGENIWLQIIIKAHKKEDKKEGTWFDKTDNWIDEAKKEIAKIREESVMKNGDGAFSFPLLTKGQTDKISAIEKSISKLGFDCGIRGIYIAEKDVFDKGSISALIGSLQQYGSPYLNGFKPGPKTKFDYKYQDFFGTKLKKMKDQIFDDYQKRAYWGTVLNKKRRQKFVLNSEELATIFHFPSSATGTPTLKRVESKKSEAPSNLPIQ